MKGNHMTLDSLKALYIRQLKAMYSAEKQLLDTLPRMASVARNPALKACFTSHLQETVAQQERLALLLHGQGEKPADYGCKALNELIEKCNEVMQQDSDPDRIDTALIAAAQHIKHYEIAGYRCLRTYAMMLGSTGALSRLKLSLSEEANAGKNLTKIAMSFAVVLEFTALAT